MFLGAFIDLVGQAGLVKQPAELSRQIARRFIGRARSGDVAPIRIVQPIGVQGRPPCSSHATGTRLAC